MLHGWGRCLARAPGFEFWILDFCAFVQDHLLLEYWTVCFLPSSNITSPFWWASFASHRKKLWEQRTLLTRSTVICLNLCYFNCEIKVAWAQGSKQDWRWKMCPRAESHWMSVDLNSKVLRGQASRFPFKQWEVVPWACGLVPVGAH